VRRRAAVNSPTTSARRRGPVIVVALLLAAVAGVVAPASARATPADARLAGLAHEYREGLLADRPDLASRSGDHRGDGRLEPVTQASLARAVARLRSLAARLDSIPRDALAPAAARERDTLAARIAAARHELEVERRWERDPAAYLDLAGDAVATLMRRGPGPTCLRTRDLARRLARVPDVLRAARINLREPPRALIEGALPGYERLLGFYRGGLAAFGARCHEPRVQADLAEADSTAVRAVADFLDYLRVDLLPRAADAVPGPGILPDSTRGAAAPAR
jgi:hypothetical protein